MENRFQLRIKFVISTGAYPSFLPRSAGHATCAALIEESRMKITNATKLNRKSGVAQWRDRRFFSVLMQTLSSRDSS
jgi:hypothetical protein